MAGFVSIKLPDFRSQEAPMDLCCRTISFTDQDRIGFDSVRNTFYIDRRSAWDIWWNSTEAGENLGRQRTWQKLEEALTRVAGDRIKGVALIQTKTTVGERGSRQLTLKEYEMLQRKVQEIVGLRPATIGVYKTLRFYRAFISTDVAPSEQLPVLPEDGVPMLVDGSVRVRGEEGVDALESFDPHKLAQKISILPSDEPIGARDARGIANYCVIDYVTLCKGSRSVIYVDIDDLNRKIAKYLKMTKHQISPPQNWDLARAFSGKKFEQLTASEYNEIVKMAAVVAKNPTVQALEDEIQQEDLENKHGDRRSSRSSEEETHQSLTGIHRLEGPRKEQVYFHSSSPASSKRKKSLTVITGGAAGSSAIDGGAIRTIEIVEEPSSPSSSSPFNPALIKAAVDKLDPSFIISIGSKRDKRE